MDPLLLIITVISLIVALVASVIAWRGAQEEKRRAEARVAALAAAAGMPDTAPGDDAEARPAATSTPIAAPWRSPVGLDNPAAVVQTQAATPDAVATGSPAMTPVSVPTGFLGAEAPARESSHHQRWLTAAAAVVAVLLSGFVLARVGTQTRAVEAARQEAAPLELLSLRHEREGANLSVAGLIRNPPAASLVERLTAVVFLFDQQGQFVTSAQAPIDFLKLTAGDESPFVVKLAAPQTVARYRVSFRTDDGARPHVDRRAGPPGAAPAALAGQ